jgi:hypothetical protein
MAISVTLTRTLLGLGNLSLANAASDPIQFGEFVGNGITWSRLASTSPWIDGERLRAASRQQSSLTGEFYIVTALSTAPATHDGHLDDLLAALGQFAWQLSITISSGGTLTRTYDCEPADVTPDESYNMADTFRWTTVKVTIPHAPVPSSGAW